MTGTNLLLPFSSWVHFREKDMKLPKKRENTGKKTKITTKP